MPLYGDLEYDSRVRKEAASLAEAGYQVSIVCLDGGSAESRAALPGGIDVTVLRPTRTSVLPGSRNPFLAGGSGRIGALARRVRWLAGYAGNLRTWGASVPEACGPVDIWHLHDFFALAAVAPRLKDGVPVVYDAHDLFLESGTTLHLPRLARRLLRWYERRLVSKVSAVVTVNESIADVLAKRYRPRRVEVVHNCPDWSPPPTDRPTLIRDAARVPVDAPVILYHGSLTTNRGIEQLMDALVEPGLERAHLVLMGFGAQKEEYGARAQDPRWAGRIHVLDAVPPEDLLAWVAGADVGAMPIQASTLNHYLSTPNKLFESLGAGIPVVVSDFPTMRRIVLDDPRGPLGAVCDPSSARAIAAALRSVLELADVDRAALRDRCLTAARDRWNWGIESSRLVRLHDELVGRRDGGTPSNGTHG
jgi:glycosyltransferase involved in cell wall biosynthesis